MTSLHGLSRDQLAGFLRVAQNVAVRQPQRPFHLSPWANQNVCMQVPGKVDDIAVKEWIARLDAKAHRRLVETGKSKR